MAENGAAPEAKTDTPQVKMNVINQFIRDLSFENILAQKGVHRLVNLQVPFGEGTFDARRVVPDLRG